MKLATGLRVPGRGTIRIDGAPPTGPLKIGGMSFQAPSIVQAMREFAGAIAEAAWKTFWVTLLGFAIAIVGTVPAEMTAGDPGIGYLMQAAGSQQRMPPAFAGLVAIGMMAMVMYELFSMIEKRTTGWAHRGTQGD